jgi:prepilin-type N-terminal cleavage/methylation domain-containing protein
MMVMRKILQRLLVWPRAKVNSGQTLIELMIALAVIAIGLTAILTLTTRSVKTSEVTKIRQDAVSLARTKIDEVRFARETTPNWDDFVQSDLVSDSSSEAYPGTTGGLVWQISSSSPSQGALEIVVTVSWEDVSGRHYCTPQTPDSCIREEITLTKWK